MNAPPAAPVVAFAAVSRSFAGVPVLTGVSLEAHAGRVLALIGENGAGKSTLMNILGGGIQPERGHMTLDGQPYAPRTPQEARARGIAFVHQELNLFPNLTIAENLCLQAFPRRGRLPWIDRAATATRAQALLARVGLALDPNARLEGLSAGERQLVEIAKALASRARVLILDEPTTSLSARERGRLFALIRELRDQQLALVYISHDLADTLELCDDVAVLRDGVVVARGPAREFAVHRLVRLMVGREATQLYPPRPASAIGPEARLEVRHVSEPGVVRDISFTVGRGEIVGLFGMMGAGRSELARLLFGLDPLAAGEVRLDGRVLDGGPRARHRRGLAFVSDDRRRDGLCLDASVADNVLLATLAEHCRTPLRLLATVRAAASVRRIRDAVRLSPTVRDAQAVRTLSGGNQQKVILGRWLLAEPRVLMLDEPTRGIDIAARAEIYALIRDHAARGAGVLLISSEIEEVIGLSDRVLVLRQGELSGEFPAVPGQEVDRARLLAAALPAASVSADERPRRGVPA